MHIVPSSDVKSATWYPLVCVGDVGWVWHGSSSNGAKNKECPPLFDGIATRKAEDSRSDVQVGIEKTSSLGKDP